MRGKNTIIINGHIYDAVTGLAVAPGETKNRAKGRIISDFGPVTVKPVKKTSAAPNKKASLSHAVHAPRTAHASRTLHSAPQRSTTLLRTSAIKQPDAYVEKGEIKRSPMISKFATHPKPLHSLETKPAAQGRQVAADKPAPAETSVAPKPTHHQSHNTPAPKNASRELKQRLIKEGLENVDTSKKSEEKRSRLRSLARKQPKAVAIVTGSLALLLFGGYLAYINMPGLSLRVASSRAGVSASFPDYHPSGYHYTGPVAYSPGEVTISFSSNTNNQGYTVKQAASNWDSQAVLDNFVSTESNSYLTYSEQGLTIYTFDNKAAWVNGGVLYTIDGDAPLSSEQVLKIAASL